MAESVQRPVAHPYTDSPYLTQEEVQALIERLSASKERTSVHDVAEATGLTPEQVQLVVSEMRRSESQVAQQRREIEDLRAERDALTKELASRPKRRERDVSSIGFVAIVFIICFTIVALNLIRANATSFAPPAPPPMETARAVDVGAPAATAEAPTAPAGSPTN